MTRWNLPGSFLKILSASWLLVVAYHIITELGQPLIVEFNEHIFIVNEEYALLSPLYGKFLIGRGLPALSIFGR